MWLIIGYGNLLRQDDGVGYRVAEMLATQLDPQRARVLAVHQLTPELVLDLAAEDVEQVLFIDARRNQAGPLLLCKLNPAAAQGQCGHQLAPDLLLYMTHTLYQRSPRGWLLSLAAEEMAMGENFSRTARSATGAAAILVKKILAKTSKVVTK